ncbi:MAG: hypothetical protein ACFFDM_00020 [Candidatus Thorarchaeota archaeon]
MSFVERLNEISKKIEESTGESEALFEKLLVALTGVFRLLDQPQPTLKALQGSPQNLQTYLIRLVHEIKDYVTSNNNMMVLKIDSLIQELSKQ